MWAWIKTHPGQKFAAQGRDDIFFSVDKPLEERIYGKKVGHCMRESKVYFTGKLGEVSKEVMKKHVDISNEFLMLQDPVTQKMRKAAKKNDDNNMEIMDDAPAWEGLNLAKIIGDANDAA